MSSLVIKLKTTAPEIQHYVTAFESENLKLQKQIAKLQVENMSLNNRIKAIEKEKSIPHVLVNMQIITPPLNTNKKHL